MAIIEVKVLTVSCAPRIATKLMKAVIDANERIQSTHSEFGVDDTVRQED